MSSSWWRPALNDQGLSQGDIVQPVPFGISANPPVRLNRISGKKRAELWSPTAKEAKGKQHFLFEGKEAHGLVVSHDCDIDKSSRRQRVLIVPIRSTDGLDPDIEANIMGQRRVSLVPLPAVPGLGDCYADLRNIAPVDRNLVPDEVRIASMTVDGVARLHAQIDLFFSRRGLEEEG